MDENIVILGASGHAKVVIDILYKAGKTIVGLIDEVNLGKTINNCTIIGNTANLPELSRKYKFNKGVIAVGNNTKRVVIKNQVMKYMPNFEFVCAVHPSSNVSTFVEIGSGSVIMAGVTINSNCIIGEHCILNTNSSLDHESTMCDFSQVGPGVNVAGNVYIGNTSFIGIGANIIQNIKIGNNTVIGAGSLVNRDIGDNELGYGVPYKRIKMIRKDEIIY